MKTIKVSKSDNGIRLDKFLFKILTHAPGSVVYKSLRKKRVRVNGKRVTDGGVVLKNGDILELYINDEFFGNAAEPWKNSKIVPKILYEDGNIAVIYKPSGLPSQDMPNGDGYSLESGFRAYLFKKGELSDNAAYIPSLCHRIDRNTSGLIIGSKNINAHRIITEKIKNKEIRKLYLCSVEGELLPKSSYVRGYIVKEGNNRVSFTESKTDNGKEAALSYRVLEYKNGFSKAEVELHSGRTHQIRATMSYLGHPIKGDVKYGAKRRGAEYQDLCAYKLIFEFKTDAGELNYLSGEEFVYAEY